MKQAPPQVIAGHVATATERHGEKPLQPEPVRGKYAILLKQGSNIVLLDPDLLDSFPDSPSVNRALRAFLAINQHVQSATPRVRSRRPPSPASSAFDPPSGTPFPSAVRKGCAVNQPRNLANGANME